jgi:hypothetical protein
MSTRVRTHMDTLRALATANDLNQVILVEQCIDDYLKANGGRLPHALERLRNAIHDEEVASRAGEDWSIAKNYVRRMLHAYSLIFQPEHSEGRFETSEVRPWSQSLLQSPRRKPL